MSTPLVAPFPWFGGKRRAASLVWQALGDVTNYVEPFFGSGAVLLARPDGAGKVETINDLDAMLANFWRASQADPDAVARWADWPVNEVDLEARHAWLVNRRERLRWSMADPDFFDAKIAGWWLWGACAWIGSGWCAGKGPWQSNGVEVVDSRQLPHVGNAGRGINRRLPHVGDAGRGINRRLPHVGDAGRGINRKLPHVGDAGRGEFIRGWIRELADRMRDVRVACGDWSRVLGSSVTTRHGLTGVFLDPPYDDGAVDYAAGGRVSADVREWALAHGDDPKLRIVLCGYEGEHAMPDSWRTVPWKAAGGYGGQRRVDGTVNANSARERLWLSPHCLPMDDQSRLPLEAA